MEAYNGWVPQEPDESVRQFAAQRLKEEFIVYKVEWVDETNFSDLLAGRKRKEKLAKCSCSACETTFYADLLRQDDAKHGYVDPINYDAVENGSCTLCPYCGAQVTAIHTSQFGSYKTRFAGQMKIMQIVKHNEKVAFVIWYAEKHIDKHAKSLYRIERWAAYLPSGRSMTKLTGQQRYFNTYHVFYRWQKMAKCYITDIVSYEVMPFDSHYLDGTEFENAKLDLLCATKNPAVVAYARTYQRWPNIENIITAGGGELFSDCALKLSEQMNSYNCSTYFRFGTDALRGVFDFKKVKPHEMLHASKEELRELKAAGMTYKLFKNFKALKEIDERFTVELAAKVDSAKLIREIAKQVDPIKAVRYLHKTGKSDVIYLDYLKARRYAELPLETQIDLFPRDLIRRHDEAVHAMNAKKQKDKQEKYREKYKNLTERYSETAYKDDELCVFICPSADEMWNEGRVLHHCVATYVERHASGESLIFFVRRARRPERSYYTLNIEVGTNGAREVQLHGYKNDAMRKIPPEVRAFVDRWEQEILFPFCKKQKERKKTA